MNQAIFNTLTTESANRRRKSFEANLIEYVKIQHESFLKFHGCKEVFLQSGLNWHPRFTNDGFSVVELSELPSKPENRSKVNLEDFTFQNSEDLMHLFGLMKKSSTKKYHSDCEDMGIKSERDIISFVANLP